MQAEAKVLVKEEPAEDLSKIKPVKSLQPVRELLADRTKWEDVVRAASSVFAEHGDVLNGTVTYAGSEVTRWFANTLALALT